MDGGQCKGRSRPISAASLSASASVGWAVIESPIVSTRASASIPTTPALMISVADIPTTTTPSSSSSVQSYLGSLKVLYAALQIDLRAVKPPAGSEQKFSAFQASINKGIQELQAAGSALSSGDQTQLRTLGPELTSLGTTVNREASALGLTC